METNENTAVALVKINPKFMPHSIIPFPSYHVNRRFIWPNIYFTSPLHNPHSFRTETTMEDQENPTSTTANTAVTGASDSIYSDDIDSTCSTPYVSAPSSPGRGPPLSGFFYSAPASPMHFVLSTTNVNVGSIGVESSTGSSSFEFDFSSRMATDTGASPESMSSADELFLNGQIRPMKLSRHLERPQMLSPLPDLDESEDQNEEKFVRTGRDLKFRAGSLRRRTRSMSPLRTNNEFDWHENDDENEKARNEIKKLDEELNLKLNNNGNGDGNAAEVEAASNATTPCASASSSRSSSVGRSSRRWIFLKEFLYRSKSEGRNNGHKFWGSITFSPIKETKKSEKPTTTATPPGEIPAAGEGNKKTKQQQTTILKEAKKKAVNGVGKRRVPPPSPHELHYTANRAQAEEMRKKTFLPYRQGLLGCLGFSSKGYGAMNGFARALNPVSSR